MTKFIQCVLAAPLTGCRGCSEGDSAISLTVSNDKSFAGIPASAVRKFSNGLTGSRSARAGPILRYAVALRGTSAQLCLAVVQIRKAEFRFRTLWCVGFPFAAFAHSSRLPRGCGKPTPPSKAAGRVLRPSATRSRAGDAETNADGTLMARLNDVTNRRLVLGWTRWMA